MSCGRTLVIGALGLVALIASLPSLAQSTTVTFTMPTGVDPPLSKFLDHEPVFTDAGELVSGLNVYGRAMQFSTAGDCAVVFQDITCVQIKFTSSKGVKVVPTVTKGLNYVPWQATTSRVGDQWTITLCAVPGSAPMSSWDVNGLGNGFFAALTASSGGGKPAAISNVSIVPVTFVANANQQPSGDLTDPFAPVISASVDHPTIWSPNGKPVDVVFSGYMSETLTQSELYYISGIDPCSVTATLSYTDGDVASTPVAVPLDVTVRGDGTVTFTLSIALTADRDGSSLEGRVYTLRITAYDYAGNVAVPVDSTVTVTHDQSGP